jgi:hypothetical protein
MDIDQSPITDVNEWVKHFTSVINGDIIPDERTGVFLVRRTSAKKENNKDKDLAVTIVSPIARDIDSAKSELEEQNERDHPTDNDPISHFPERNKADLNPRKRPYNRKAGRVEKKVKAKKSRTSLWNKY